MPSPNSEILPPHDLSNETVPTIISAWIDSEPKTENGDSRFDPAQSLMDWPAPVKGRAPALTLARSRLALA